MYNNVQIPISTLIALLVCLIPTTIGGLLSAIGIAGMDRVTRFNVIAKMCIRDRSTSLFADLADEAQLLGDGQVDA